VRDINMADERRMLLVTTGRVSAFNVVMPTPIRARGGC
jgi:phosphoribosylaminoimidazole-succinocarboxamide synthase